MHEEAMKLLAHVKEVAIEVNDEPMRLLIEYIEESLWQYEDMRNSK